MTGVSNAGVQLKQTVNGHAHVADAVDQTPCLIAKGAVHSMSGGHGM